MIYHLDFETRSRADLKKVGAYRYASDPSTEILLCAIAQGTDEPLLWVNPKYAVPGSMESDPGVFALMAGLCDPSAVVYAHNAPFEIPVTRYRMVDRLFSLWHHAIVSSNHQDHDIGSFSTTSTHCRKGFVTRSI